MVHKQSGRFAQESLRPVLHGSGKGAENFMLLFSLIETAKFNGKSPEDYLRCLFEQAPYAETESDWEKLPPWNIKIITFQIRGVWRDLANQG